MSAQPPAPGDRHLTTAEVAETLARLGRMRRDVVKAEPPAASPTMSFKGWAFEVWLRKNKAFVKIVLAPVTAILTSGTVAPELVKPALLALGLGVLTILAKLGWDAFDYFVSEQPGA